MHINLKIAFRHLWKNRFYSVLTSLGLSVGLASLLLAVLYVQDEWSFDRFHNKNPNLYRITTSLAQNPGDHPRRTGGTGQVQGPAFKAQVPEVEAYTRVMGGDIFADVQANEKILKLQTLYVDENFFDVFSFKLLSGHPQSVLHEVNSVVITEQTALRFFNSTDVVGKLLSIDSDPSLKRLGKPLVITGVVQNPPKNSSIQFDMLHPFRFMQLSFDDTFWLNAYLGTFVVLRPDSDIQLVTQKFNRIYSQAARKQLSQQLNANGHNPKIHYGLQSMTDIHLNPLHLPSGSREGGVVQASNPMYSYLFLGIAVFILLMSSINFVTISLASSMNRAKEVGIRKVTGSSQLQLMGQFLGESALLCSLAFGLALLWTQLALPVFNELADKHIQLQTAWTPTLLGCLMAIFLLNCLLTGVYPAYVVTRFNPVQVLYHKPKLTGRNYVGKSLVVVQFGLAMILIVASVVFHHQMDYIRIKDLGYNPHQIVRTHISGSRDYKAVQQFLTNAVAHESSITGISFGQEYGTWQTSTRVNNRTLQSSYQAVDFHYIPLLDIKIKEGRIFSESFPSDPHDAVVVNEAFVKAAVLKRPIGASLGSEQLGEKQRQIIGVVNDSHFGSLHERIQPMVFFMTTGEMGSIWLKVSKTRQQQALQTFEKLYHQAMPNALYEYNFLDELNARQYKLEQQWQQIIGYATAISALICCLGLVGLVHLAAEQRTKEIGIRKVLGASVSSIVALLSRDFLKLVLVAILIASPIAYYFMNQWLQNFAYHIDINGWVFTLAGFFALLIAFVTVSFQAIRAALANPVKSLRSEQ